MLSFVCFLRMTHKKLKLNFISAAIQLLIAIWCFLIKTCYYTQRIVFFRSCCTSRNFYFQPNYPIARRRRNHCMVELGGVGVPTYRNRVVIFFWHVIDTSICYISLYIVRSSQIFTDIVIYCKITCKEIVSFLSFYAFRNFLN